ncbi:hypothetical protein [Polymorphospora rubra]|uniref:Scaffolding protein n=1 Tax=Polymorphospora rubra TaxID=338584 RepID=A0A810MSY8_9ACTN|nr:hypothetical protein [Polymorphospora rubra]BCJ64141.1 hypothetical protein Prubr_11620 [Polymorphospora rubra]
METSTGESTQTQTAPEQQQAGTGQQQTSQQAGQEPTGERVEDLPPWAQKALRDARTDAGKARTEAKAQAATEAAEQARNELAQKIGKALGLVKDGDTEQPDPAQLTQQLTKMADTNRDLAVELAIWKSAKKAGANPQALTDSRSFMATASKLDPTADDFSAKLRDAVKKAIDDNPQYREAGQAPARSGGEFTGGPGGDAVTPEQFKRMSAAQRNDLFQKDPALYRKLAGR